MIDPEVAGVIEAAADVEDVEDVAEAVMEIEMVATGKNAELMTRREALKIITVAVKSRKMLGMYTIAISALFLTSRCACVETNSFYSGVPVIQVAENSAGQKRGRDEDSNANGAKNGEERPAKKVDAKEA